MKRLSWRSILKRVEGRRIVGLWYGLEDGYLRLELDDRSTLLVAASWEGCHVVVDPAVPATRKGRPTKEQAPATTRSAEPRTPLGRSGLFAPPLQTYRQRISSLTITTRPA